MPFVLILLLFAYAAQSPPLLGERWLRDFRRGRWLESHASRCGYGCFRSPRYREPARGLAIATDRGGSRSYLQPASKSISADRKFVESQRLDEAGKRHWSKKPAAGRRGLTPEQTLRSLILMSRLV